MWRHVVHTQGASTGRSCAVINQSKRLGACSFARPQQQNASTTTRSLSSAQPSSWDEHSPFAMSSAPSLQEMANPTAERVVMKTFLNTLKVSAVSSSNVECEETIDVNDQDSVEGTQQDWSLQVVEEQQTSLVAVSSVVSVPVEQEEAQQDSSESSHDSTPSTTQAAAQHQQSQPSSSSTNRKYHGHLVHAIHTKHAEKARTAYRDCLQNNVSVNKKYLVPLFNLVVSEDPITALAAIKHYRQITGRPVNSAIYARLCQKVGTVPWHVAKTGQFTKMCHDLREELVELPDDEYRKRCFQVLLVSLVQQPMHRIGKMARGLYQFMVTHEYPLAIGKMCHILTVSRYTRQGDLSFPSILARLVNEGYRPHPPLAIHTLQNLFPYTNVDETILALKSIIELHSSWEPGNMHPNYKVDIGTLEHVMAAAARKGSFELNILVWDLVDLLGYEPTECMYENTMQGFVMGPGQDANMFVVLGEMEERGFVPSRALIRSLSRSLRFSERRVDYSYNLLTSRETEGIEITLSTLNVVLSASAELGDVDRTFATFDDFDSYGIEPNTDSYSFLLEALSRSVNPLYQKDDEQRRMDAPGRMDAAAAILSLMEEKGVEMCHHCIEHYAQLLYNVGRLDAATEFLMDSLERGDPVNNRVIINMSKNNALVGNIEVARLLSKKTTENFRHLDHRIDEIEKQLRRSQGRQAIRLDDETKVEESEE